MKTDSDSRKYFSKLLYELAFFYFHIKYYYGGTPKKACVCSGFE